VKSIDWRPCECFGAFIDMKFQTIAVADRTDQPYNEYMYI
jgi:hypothetical protein